MKKILLSAGFLMTFGFFSTTVQAQTGIAFDGINDHILTSVPSIQGSASRTVEAWVKCSNNSSQAFMIDMGETGLGSGARFGMKLNPSSSYLRIEIGGAGITGTKIIANNAWHHVAVVYDDDVTSNKYKLYVDGLLDVQGNMSVALNTTTANETKIGVRNDGGTGYFKGAMDEVRIWNVARTQAQIQANMSIELCPQEGLVAYYRFNEGVAGVDNTTLLAVNDSSGSNYEGSLENFTLTGAISNFVDGATLAANAIDVTVVNVDNVLTVGEAVGANVAYQWYDCSGAEAVLVAGATSQNFTLTQPGSFSVEVTKNGCTETSECTVIASLSAQNFETNVFKMYPNPASNQVTIQLGDFYTTAEVTLTNVAGQQIMKKAVANTNEVILDLNQSAGVYFVSVVTSTGTSKVMKLVKQ